MSAAFGSLFAGIGGFDLALERAGFECRWQVEVDANCQNVLERHWPQVKRYWDVRKVTGDELGAVDVLCGGFPCQDVSVAGRREGLAGERSGLWTEFARLVGELRPGWVVIENVPGLLSSAGGRDFALVLRGLVERGYGVAYRVLDAQHFGVAQRRRRVFVVASLGSGRAAEVLFESAGGGWHPAPRREAGEGAAPGAGRGAEGAGLFSDSGGNSWRLNRPTLAAPDDNGTNHLVAGQCHGNNVGPMGTLRQGNGGLTGGVPFVAHTLTANYGKQLDNSDRHGGPPNLIYGITGQHTAAEDLCPTMQQPSNSGGGHPPAVCIQSGEAGAAVYDTGPTLRADRQSCGEYAIAHALTCEGADASEDGTGRGTPLVPVAVRTAQTSANGIGVAEDLCHTLDQSNAQAIAFHCTQDPISGPIAPAMGTGNRQGCGALAVAFQLTGDRDDPGVSVYEDVHPTLAANPMSDRQPAIAFDWQAGHGKDESFRGKSRQYVVRKGDYTGALQENKRDAVCTHMAVRRLTPTECSRLQGFPDDWLEVTDANAEEAHAREVLHGLWRSIGTQDGEGRRFGVAAALLTPEVLLAGVYGGWLSWEMAAAAAHASRQVQGTDAWPEGFVRRLWQHAERGPAPHRRESFEQLARELGRPLSELPLEGAQARAFVRGTWMWEEASAQWPLRPPLSEGKAWGGAGLADSTRYRQLGNAVCVPVAEWLGHRILEAIANA